MPHLRFAVKRELLAFRCKENLFRILYQHKYTEILSAFDIYFSPFLPVSPFVYSSGIKSALFIHDVIPLACPHFSTPEFCRRYASWMSDVAADLIFFNSEYSKCDFFKYATLPQSAVTFKTGLAAGESFRPLTNSRLIKSVKRKYNISAETYFLGLSADSPRKNFLHLIKSFCCFARQNPENKSALVIAGSNTEKIKSRLREIENYKNFASRIIFTGYVDNADLAPLYNGALAFVYPSLYEGFGLPVLEAMQCGTPVICADNSSLPEVGGKAPLYISADDEQETAAALKTISDNESLRQKLSELGKKQAENFNWRQTIETIVKGFKNVCSM